TRRAQQHLIKRVAGDARGSRGFLGSLGGTQQPADLLGRNLSHGHARSTTPHATAPATARPPPGLRPRPPRRSPPATPADSARSSCLLLALNRDRGLVPQQ